MKRRWFGNLLSWQRLPRVGFWTLREDRLVQITRLVNAEAREFDPLHKGGFYLRVDDEPGIGTWLCNTNGDDARECAEVRLLPDPTDLVAHDGIPALTSVLPMTQLTYESAALLAASDRRSHVISTPLGEFVPIARFTRPQGISLVASDLSCASCSGDPRSNRGATFRPQRVDNRVVYRVKRT